MKELTNSIIISDLNTIKHSINHSLIIWTIAIISLTILFIWAFKKSISDPRLIKQKNRNIILIIISFIFMLIIFIPTFSKNLFLKNAIQCSLDNNTWSIEIDTLEKLEKDTIVNLKRTNIKYYAHFSEHGKVQISRKGYENLTENQDTYIIIVKGKLGSTYVTRLIYPTNEFNYIP